MSELDPTYSGDITVNGDEQAPIRITDPENVHIPSGAVDGDLEVRNAEYVYTNTPAGGTVDIGAVETEISGQIEDCYIKRGCGSGDLVITDAEDVFIEHDAVGGDLQIVGAEQRFQDPSDTHPVPPAQYDDEVTGWNRSLSVTNPDTGVAVVGAETELRVQDADSDIELYVTGWNNSVRIDGVGNTVTIHFVGAQNTVETSAYVDTEIATDSGHDNTVETDSFPVEDLIETTQREAYNGVFIGQKKVTYQKPAGEKDHCPNCGANADAIIKRHQENSFFIFGYPIYEFESGSKSHECEECSLAATPEVSLSESERKDILQ